VYPPGIERARGERPVCSFKTTSVQVALKWMGVWSRSGFEMDGCLVSRGGPDEGPICSFKTTSGVVLKGPNYSFKTTREWF
jgi:hypothetical protein